LENAVHRESAPEGATAPTGAALVVDKLACSLVGQAHPVQIAPGTRAHAAYGVERAVEQFRCTYGLNPAYRAAFEAAAFEGGSLKVTGTGERGEARIVELPAHPFFVATLFLPQLTSSPETPHPLIVAYLKAARDLHGG
jgi:CTP synthase (UTP-ammonia lyase)